MGESRVFVEGIGRIGKKEFEQFIDFSERFDFIDIQILRKFYATGKEFPMDAQPHCFPLLYTEMSDSRQYTSGREGLRKRLDNLVRMEFLTKVRHSNPANYGPVMGKGRLVNAIILKFLAVQGLKRALNNQQKV